jgi:hypothetical protein
MRGIKIDGFIGIPDTMTHDEFIDSFIAWLEENGCEFGGVTDEDAASEDGYDA